eukprot:193537-Alexandrium_andersonii.AAC.1
MLRTLVNCYRNVRGDALSMRLAKRGLQKAPAGFTRMLPPSVVSVACSGGAKESLKSSALSATCLAVRAWRTLAALT